MFFLIILENNSFFYVYYKLYLFRNFLITSPLRPFSVVAWFSWACNASCLINCGEVIFLLLLASVSSVEDYCNFYTAILYCLIF